MPYIITDGTSYCHRTKTQAVELVSELSEATRFRNEQSAQKLLARATKKLKGFELVEIASRREEAQAQAAARAEEKTADTADVKQADEKTAAAGADSQVKEARKDNAQKNTSRKNGSRRSRKSSARTARETADLTTAQAAEEQKTDALPAEQAAVQNTAGTQTPEQASAQTAADSQTQEQAAAEQSEGVSAEQAAGKADNHETHEGTGRKRRRSHRSGRRSRAQAEARENTDQTQTTQTAEETASAETTSRVTTPVETVSENAVEAVTELQTQIGEEAAAGTAAQLSQDVPETETVETPVSTAGQTAEADAAPAAEDAEGVQDERGSADAGTAEEAAADSAGSANVAEEAEADSAGTAASAEEAPSSETDAEGTADNASDFEASMESTAAESANTEDAQILPISTETPVKDHSFRKRDRRKRFDRKGSMTDNTASLWGEPVDISARTHAPKSAPAVKTAEPAEPDKAAVEDTTLETTVDAVMHETAAAQDAPAKYPTRFTRKKKAAADWRIEDATSRVFGRMDTTAAAPASAPVHSDSTDHASGEKSDSHNRKRRPFTRLSQPSFVEEISPAAQEAVSETVTEASLPDAMAAPQNETQSAPIMTTEAAAGTQADRQESEVVQENDRDRSSRRDRRRRPRRGSIASAPAAQTDEAAVSTAPAAQAEADTPAQAAPAVDVRSDRGDRNDHSDRNDRRSRNSRQSRSNVGSRSGSFKDTTRETVSTASRRRLFTQQERNLIYNRSEGHCGICGRFIPLEEYTIDHIIPLSKGGTNDLDNLQACCSFCNKAKDDSQGDEFFRRIQRIYLYQAELRYPKKQYKKLKKTIKELSEEDD